MVNMIAHERECAREHGEPVPSFVDAFRFKGNDQFAPCEGRYERRYVFTPNKGERFLVRPDEVELIWKAG